VVEALASLSGSPLASRLKAIPSWLEQAAKDGAFSGHVLPCRRWRCTMTALTSKSSVKSSWMVGPSTSSMP
jgi:hypothetical protein